MIGVYLITNLVNGKRYVGCSINIKKRWHYHRAPSKLNNNLSIARAFRKYGVANFRFEIVEECALDQLDEREKAWIANLKPEYNRTAGGRGRARPLSSAERAILSEKSKEQWRRMTPEQRHHRIENNLTGPSIGHKRSWEMRRRISATLTGRVIGPFTQERRDSIRAGILKNGAAWGAKRYKPIAQINDKGRVVWYWASTKLAAAKFGINPSTITHVLKGSRKTAAGFRWVPWDIHATTTTDPTQTQLPLNERDIQSIRNRHAAAPARR